LQAKHSIFNDGTNLDVEKTNSVSNTHQDRSKENEMHMDSKDKKALASEMTDKVIENDLKREFKP
jgi:hypothetical protein